MPNIIKRLQSNFSSGELSGLIEGRPDLAKFFNGSSILENFWIYYEGGVFRRPGTSKIQEVKNSANKTVLIDFRFSHETSYVIEAGDKYFRFYKRGFGGNDRLVPIVDGSGNPIEVVVPWGPGDYPDLQWRQSADIMYFTHPNFQQRKLNRVDDTHWSMTLFVSQPPPSLESGDVLPSDIAFTANTGNAIPFHSGADVFLAADVNRTITAGAGRAIIRTIVDGQNGTVDIIDDFTQTITGGPNTLDTSGTALTSTAHGLAIGNYVTLTDGTEVGELRRVVGIGSGTATLDFAFSADQTGTHWAKIIAISTGNWVLQGSPQAQLTVSIKAPVGAIVSFSLDKDGFRQECVGEFIKVDGGLIEITQISDASHGVGIIRSILTQASDTPAPIPGGAWSTEMAAWSDANGWPAALEFHQARLWFGSTKKQPTTLWGSATADFQNFAIGSLAANAVQYTIANRTVNSLHWLRSLKLLFIGDAENEHDAKGPGVDAPIGGDVIPYVIDEGDNGAMHQMPIVIQRAILFIQFYGRKIVEMTYDIASDGFIGQNLMLYSRHIGDPIGFAQHPPVYAKNPHSAIHFPRNDGQLADFTYYRAEQVAGWSRTVTDGEIESVVSIPNQIHGQDDLVIAVKRTVNGQTKRFIENVIFPTDSSTALAGREWQEYHTDCGADGILPAGTQDILGLDYLEAKAVDVILDGSFIGQRTVVEGAISVDAADRDRSYEVGLHYKSTCRSMRPSIPNQVVDGLMRQWKNITIRVLKSLGGTVNGEQIDYSAAALDTVKLRSGSIKVNVSGEMNLDGYATIEQNQPYPFTLLSLSGAVMFADYE